MSTVSRVVRYTGMPAAADAVSLSLKGREIGHRTLRRFYRQSFKAHSTSLGAAKPELQALMEQYATAGVLSAHTPSLAAGAHKRNEVRTMQRLGLGLGLTLTLALTLTR